MILAFSNGCKLSALNTKIYGSYSCKDSDNKAWHFIIVDAPQTYEEWVATHQNQRQRAQYWQVPSHWQFSNFSAYDAKVLGFMKRKFGI